MSRLLYRKFGEVPINYSTEKAIDQIPLRKTYHPSSFVILRNLKKCKFDFYTLEIFL